MWGPEHAGKRIIVLGDQCHGRNQLVRELVGLNQGPDEPVQSLCEYGTSASASGKCSWSLHWMSKGELVAVTLNDVSNMWGDWSRPRSYTAHSDAAVLCFSLHSPSSIDSISSRWFPEVWNNKRFTPVFLVGINEHPEKPTLIPRQQCIQEAKRIGAVYYLEYNAASSAGANVLCNVLVQTLGRKIEIQGDRWEPFSGIGGYTGGFGVYGHVCTVCANRLYLFGGRSRDGVHPKGYYLELPVSQDSGWKWKSVEGKAQFPPFPAYCTAMNGQLVYFFGGSSNLPDESALMVFDTTKSRLETIVPANSAKKSPPESYGGTLVIHENKLYLFGGSVSGVATGGFYEFNLIKKVWKELTAKGRAPPERFHHSSYCKNGVMVILCGLGNNRDKYNDVWTVDLAKASAEGKATWNLIPCRGTPPTPQRGHAGCLLNNDSFMFVGSSNANPQCEFFHFDTNTFTWRKMEMQMAPASREFFGITAWRNHIIVTSGMWRSMTSAILDDGCISVTPSLFPETAQEQNTITKLAPSLTLSDGGTLSACQVFPPDCWMQVISFLEADDICRLGAVSKELYCICVKDEVWKKFLPVELHGGTGLKALCIPAWKNPSPLVPIGPVSPYTGPEPPSCFLGDGRVLMSDGTTKAVSNIQPGDCVMTENNRGRAVALIQSSTRTNPMRLAFINGIGLTTGHPVWQQHQHQQSADGDDGHCGETGEWVRACDHKDAVLRVVADVGTLYNFVLEGGPQEPDHSVIINSSVIVCTLGKDCGPVMREKYPRADMLYGTGYWKSETKE